MVVILLIVFILIHPCVPSSRCNEPRAYRDTEEWKHLFIGKCLLYRNDYGPRVLCDSNINCNDLWPMVKTAVESQPKCNFSMDNYEEFLIASAHYVPENKFLFWSGVYSLVMRYSDKGRKFYTISDTLTGYLFDNVVWCGNTTEADGIEKYPGTCPGFEIGPECPSSAQSVFWATASQHYARHAYGEVHVMINASRTPAFRNSSYFTQYELPNLNATKVPKATILMVHYITDPVLETCSSESIEKLKSSLNETGITPYCIDNPRDVQLLLCVDIPTHPQCEQLISSSHRERYSLYLFSIIVFIFSLA